MEIISSRKQVQALLEALPEQLAGHGLAGLLSLLRTGLLQHKVKFPVLEQVAKEIYRLLPQEQQPAFCQAVVGMDEIGSYVLAGMMLQLRLPTHWQESARLAEAYMIQGNTWYVCDIIGERVFGHGLLRMPDRMFPILEANSRHENKWLVRSVGVAGHYAIKKGLEKNRVEDLFKLLLSLATVSDFHTKKGIGWAAKTTAKFYPDLVERYRSRLMDKDIRPWFYSKIKMGLGRAEKYAGRFGPSGVAEL